MTFNATALATFYPNHITGAEDAYNAACDAASEDARMVVLTGRLSLPEGTYSKQGGTARMTIARNADTGAADLSYLRSDGVTVPLTGVQAERQFVKLLFRVIGGYDMPLVRKARTGAMPEPIMVEDAPNSQDAEMVGAQE